jgi:hypothetical protein
VPIPILLDIGVVPIKSNAMLQRIDCHISVYDHHIHN